MEHLSKYQDLFAKSEGEIVEFLMKDKGIVLQRDKAIAKFLGITYPQTVSIIRKASEIFEWQQVNPERLEKIIRIQKEQEDEVALDTNQIRQIAKKITITLNEGGITDYGMEEMEQQIFNALESSLKSGEIGTETL
ncbi:37508_t:CDS:1, partial [Gigaspora margarita]